MTKSKLVKITVAICGGSISLLLLLVGGFIYSLPKLTEKPDIRVLSVPTPVDAAKSDTAVLPYAGVHPRFKERPPETFSFPIALGEVGPLEPLFAPHNKYPFLCGKDRSREASDRQPLVDNQFGYGVPVFLRLDDNEGDAAKDAEVVGYSKDCLLATRARYFYNRVGTREFYPLDQADGDIEKIVVAGREVDFVVRLETGTINRFIYAIAVLRGDEESLAKPSGTYWNQRLIYQFRGGVGVGKRQGDFGLGDIFGRRYDELKQGYAVAYSTANQTKNHYNIWLAEDTALRVKKQFAGLYGKPLYTVGIGGSGGAIQQYLFAQNNPDLLDAAIPLYSYPDMVSQTIYVMDCEPLEYYFDVVDASSGHWRDWEKRTWLEGMSANASIESKFQRLTRLASLMTGNIPDWNSGSTECVEGWRGLTPLVHNPRFVHFLSSYADEVADTTHWTHWEDLKHFYGVNDRGYANSTWDNVGVQYGLESLKRGLLTPEQFLSANARIGGWKPPHLMEPEKLWLLSGSLFPVDLSFWSHHNMRHSADGGETPAPRTAANIGAIEGAYRSGLVFVGYADIPIIDLRHYLDRDLDMHHAAASFSARERLLRGQGSADNQVIWMTAEPHNPVAEAFAVIDQWMLNILIHPERGVVANRPERAVDKCFNKRGAIIASGDSVWDGEWNGRDTGDCMSVYPRYSTSRELAGGDIAGDVFKCELQPVAEAIGRGLYGDVDMTSFRSRLETIFPDGVCDFSRPDMGLPTGDWFGPQMVAEQAEEEPEAESPQQEPTTAPKSPLKPMTLSKLEDELLQLTPPSKEASDSKAHLN